jgi:hypothetical protein
MAVVLGAADRLVHGVEFDLGIAECDECLDISSVEGLYSAAMELDVVLRHGLRLTRVPWGP